jgi:hypothetical protein
MTTARGFIPFDYCRPALSVTKPIHVAARDRTCIPRHKPLEPGPILEKPLYANGLDHSSSFAATALNKLISG